MNKFNIRVYGILINQNKEVLVLDETRKGVHFTKFPGGGVEHQEGVEAALLRELQEELGLVVYNYRFFYFNEFHQSSAFDQSNLVAFYYIIRLPKHEFPASEQYQIPFDIEQEKQRWVELAELEAAALTFPIDQIVLEKLKAEFIS